MIHGLIKMERRVSQVERLNSEAFRHINDAKLLEMESQNFNSSI
jgi:hypothetical protein